MVLCRFAVGRIVSLELVMAVREAAPSVLSSRGPPLTGGVAGRSVRCGCQAPQGRPHDVRQRRLLYCQAGPPFTGRIGEKCLQLQVVVTRPWCGPGGYIQVGMRGCEPSGDPRAVCGRSLHLVKCSLWWKKYSVAIQAPSLGRERPLVVVVVARGALSGSTTLSWWWGVPEGTKHTIFGGDYPGETLPPFLLRGGTDSFLEGASCVVALGGLWGLHARPAGPVAWA